MTENLLQESNDALSLYRKGVACWSSGNRRQAVSLIDQAIRVKPDFADAYCMGAFILQQEGRAEPALAFYRRALDIKPDFVIALANMGKLLFELRRYNDAFDVFSRALALAPQDADLWNAASCALRKLGRIEEARKAAHKALALKPDFAEAALNLGNALLKLDRMEEALAHYRRALTIRKDFADAHCGAALALRALDRFDEALESFGRAESLGCREAVSGRGCLHLALGDFERGWQGYEARWLNGRSLDESLGARHPTWRGQLAPGLRLLVMNDHGLGDTIQFCRYLPILIQAGIRITFLCPSSLHRLVGSCANELRLIDVYDDGRYDAQIALSSLPFALRTRIETIPAQTPYLRAAEERISGWARRIVGEGLKIGLCWQGNPNPEADMSRSIPLRRFEPIAQIPGVRLFSLQKGHGQEQIHNLPHGMFVDAFGDGFDSGPDAFLDTAAIMMHLDLVICCDTSVAHLAGALGRPVWVALKKDAEWRWMREREDSPWYPSMRLFRQERRGDWSGVFGRMAKEVASLRFHQSGTA